MDNILEKTVERENEESPDNKINELFNNPNTVLDSYSDKLSVDQLISQSNSFLNSDYSDSEN